MTLKNIKIVLKLLPMGDLCSMLTSTGLAVSVNQQNIKANPNYEDGNSHRFDDHISGVPPYDVEEIESENVLPMYGEQEIKAYRDDSVINKLLILPTDISLFGDGQLVVTSLKLGDTHLYIYQFSIPG